MPLTPSQFLCEFIKRQGYDGVLYISSVSNGIDLALRSWGAANDLDIFIRPTVENACSAFEALRELEVPLEGLGPGDLLSDYDHLRFGPNENHVDVLASIGEMSFDQVWRNRIYTEVEGRAIPFISKEDPIENKRQAGRLRDLVDVDECYACLKLLFRLARTS